MWYTDLCRSWRARPKALEGEAELRYREAGKDDSLALGLAVVLGLGTAYGATLVSRPPRPPTSKEWH